MSKVRIDDPWEKKVDKVKTQLWKNTFFIALKS